VFPLAAAFEETTIKKMEENEKTRQICGDQE